MMPPPCFPPPERAVSSLFRSLRLCARRRGCRPRDPRVTCNCFGPANRRMLMLAHYLTGVSSLQCHLGALISRVGPTRIDILCHNVLVSSFICLHALPHRESEWKQHFRIYLPNLINGGFDSNEEGVEECDHGLKK